MKKGPSKIHAQQQPVEHIPISPAQAKKYQIQNSDKYPHRLVCYVKMKLTQDLNDKGTGCLISDKYLLTAAHNVIGKKNRIDKLNNIRVPFADQSYILQGLGLGQGEQKYISKFEAKNAFINPKYDQKFKQKSSAEDYALLLVNPNSVKQEKFMPIVFLSSDEAISSIKNIYIYGYPIDFNRMKSSPKDKSSIFMRFMCGGIAEVKSYQKTCISYENLTEQGTSGAPIIAEYQNQHVIIGIHKGGKQKSNEGQSQSVGVSAGQMIEQLNQYGYIHDKKPIVYTEKTLSLREKQSQMTEYQILFLMDRGLESFDILVFTSYDLIKLKKIILSGNFIGSLGVEFLLRRRFPNLKSLFLTQNKIENLGNIPEENWKNIQNLSTLALNVNHLTNIPQGIMHLKNLQKLWLAHNNFKKIPQFLEKYCKTYDTESLTVYLYENHINLEQEKQKIAQLGKGKIRIVWSRQGQQKQN